MTSTVYDVVVLGAGISGLYAARRLQANNLSVCVLEAKDRVGGRTHGVEFQGYTWDIGGTWVGPQQPRMLALIEELGFHTFKQFEEGTRVFEIDGVRTNYSGELPVYSYASAVDLFQATTRLDWMSRKITLGRAQATSGAVALDNMSVDEWLQKSCWTAYALKVLRVYFSLLFAADATDISLLFALHYIKAASGFGPISTMSGGGQDARISGGSYQLSLRMANDLGLGTNVLLSHPVASISQSQDGVTVTTTDNKQFRARYVVNTIAPLQLRDINFEPALPVPRAQLHDRFPMGRVIKCYIYYKTSFWRSHGFAGEFWTNRNSIHIFLDATLDDGSSPALVGFFTGSGAAYWAERTEAERRAEAIDIVYKCTGIEDALSPVHYMDKLWTKEPYSLGCYTGVLPARVLTTCNVDFAAPFGRIFWAGTEVAQSWVGYMEGGVDAAQRAVDRLLPFLKGAHAPPPLAVPLEPVQQDQPRSLLWWGLPLIAVAASAAWIISLQERS